MSVKQFSFPSFEKIVRDFYSQYEQLAKKIYQSTYTDLNRKIAQCARTPMEAKLPMNFRINLDKLILMWFEDNGIPYNERLLNVQDHYLLMLNEAKYIIRVENNNLFLLYFNGKCDLFPYFKNLLLVNDIILDEMIPIVYVEIQHTVLIENLDIIQYH